MSGYLDLPIRTIAQARADLAKADLERETLALKRLSAKVKARLEKKLEEKQGR